MTGFLRLARRELAARRLVFVGSVALGLASAATPWLAGTRAELAVDVRSAAALVTGAIWCFLLAAGSGITTWAHDLSEGRLAFDYRLPVSALSIWLARFGVTLFSIFAAGGLVLAAAAPFGIDLRTGFEAVDVVVARWMPEPANSLLTGVVLLFLVPLILLGTHFLGMIPRASRGWTLAALVAVVTAKLGLFRIAASVEHFDGRTTGWWLSLLAIEIGVACGLLATLAQALRGRSELDVSHQVFAIGVIAAAVFLVATGVGWRSHYVHAEPSDLSGGHLEIHALDERRVAVAGWDAKRGRMAAFVIEPATRRWRDLGAISGRFASHEVLETSATGVVAWFAGDSDGGYRLSVLPPVPWDAVAMRSMLAFSSPPRRWSIAPDGMAWASIGNNGTPMVVVRRTEERGELLRQELPDCVGPVDIAYLGPRTIGVLCFSRESTSSRSVLLRYEVDSSSGELVVFKARPEDEAAFGDIQQARRLKGLLANDESIHLQGNSLRWFDSVSGEWIPILPHLQKQRPGAPRDAGRRRP